MAFVERLMSVTFSLGQGTFGDSGASNNATLSGLRMSAKITRAGGPMVSQMSLEIYGMTLSMMNQLSTLGLIATTQRRNTIVVQAGDSGGNDPLQQVFQGTITSAWGDFQGMPDVPFRVEASNGIYQAIAPYPPSSFDGATSADQIFKTFASQWPNSTGGLGVPYQNTGVTTVLSHPVFNGALRTQILACVSACGCAWNSCEDGTFAVWMPGFNRPTPNVPLISSTTGMVGYPSFTQNGISLKTIYNPSIIFGGQIMVQSTLTGPKASGGAVVLGTSPGQTNAGANGLWNVYSLDHSLSTLYPGGDWFSTLLASPPGTGPFAPGQ